MWKALQQQQHEKTIVKLNHYNLSELKQNAIVQNADNQKQKQQNTPCKGMIAFPRTCDLLNFNQRPSCCVMVCFFLLFWVWFC